MRRGAKAAALLAALTVSACAGSGPSPAGPSSPPSSPPSSSRAAAGVGVAFDTGGRREGSANDLAWRGLEKAAKELGVNAKEVSPDPQGSNRAALLRQLATEGHNPVIAVGGAYGPTVDAVATEFPSVSFVRIDGEPSALTNVAVQDFAEGQGAFLMGVAAALKSKTNHVGFIGANHSLACAKVASGFLQGAKQITPNIVVDDVRLDPETVGTTSTNVAGARRAAQTLYQQGADVVFTVAGEAYAGSFPVALEAGKFVIGSDTDQYLTAADPAWRPVILTSMVKRVDTAVYQSILTAARGDRRAQRRTFALKDDGLTYATSGGAIDATTKAKLDDYRAKIVSGEVTVASAP